MTTNEAPVHLSREGSRNLTAEALWKIPRVGAPVPSPDGKTVAVVVTSFDLAENKGRGRIWLVPSEGGTPTPLTAAAHDSAEPAFAPDGTRLAFTRKDGEKKQLFVMPLTGGEPERVTELPLGVFDPTWLPDGSGLVFGAKLLKGHLTPEATKSEIERREKDPVKAHVTEDRVFRYWDAWLTTGEVPHFFHGTAVRVGRRASVCRHAHGGGRPRAAAHIRRHCKAFLRPAAVARIPAGKAARGN